MARKILTAKDVFSAQAAYEHKTGNKADTLHLTAEQLADLMAEVYPGGDAPEKVKAVWGLDVVISDRFSVTRGTRGTRGKKS